MHIPFTPIPDWLDLQLEVTKESCVFPTHDSLEFILTSFETLCGLSMTERQVAELTGLLVYLSENGKFEVRLTKQATRSKQHWYRTDSHFFLAAPDLNAKIKEWVERHLSKASRKHPDAFWSGDSSWFKPFLLKAEDEIRVQTLIQEIKIRFARHFFGLSDLKVWDQTASVTLKKFQKRYPKSLMPWRTGSLDGFSYKFINGLWKKRKKKKDV